MNSRTFDGFRWSGRKDSNDDPTGNKDLNWELDWKERTSLEKKDEEIVSFCFLPRKHLEILM